MERFTDHDGKSTTASGVDAEHYPDPPGLPHVLLPSAAPSELDVEAKARELWTAQGIDSPFEIKDWRKQAQQELDSLAQSRAAVELVYEKAGSVRP